ncbi:MAG: PAS domain S-box protein [Nitrospirae bacterium]|nr:PAS domain S-box protein [Nitrospirota bacterium]
MKARIIIIILSFLLLSVTVGGSFYLLYSQHENLEERVALAADESLADIATSLNLYVYEHSTFFNFIKRDDAFRHALSKPDSDSLSQANEVLDDACRSIGFLDVCYLLNLKGDTIASSNRNAPDSFLGKNYAFRPYFIEAKKGNNFVYMALGITSGKRGMYLSYPVFDKNGKTVSGVLVFKENIEHFNESINKPYEGIMLVTGLNDMIFFSNRNDLLLRPLWKLSPEEMKEVSESKQFGNGSWEWAGFTKEDAKNAVDSAGKSYHIHVKALNALPGWKIIYLHDHEIIHANYGGPFSNDLFILLFLSAVIVAAAVLYLNREAHRDILMRREAEENLRVLFESAVDAIFIIDMQGKFVDVNRTAHERLGYAKDEMLAMNIKELDPPEFAARVPERLARIKEGQATFESAHYRKDKSIMPVEVNSRILDYKGQKVYYSIIRDITERKQAIKELQDSEEKFKALSEQSITGISISQDGKFIYANPRLAEIFGFRQDEMIGSPVLERVAEADRGMVKEYFRKRLSGEAPSVHYTFRGLKRDGSEVDIEVHGGVMIYNGRPAITGTLLDITERKKTEEDKEYLNKELQQIVYTVSHDLRSPLVNIQGYSGLLISFIQKAINVCIAKDISAELKEETLADIEKDVKESVGYINSSIIKMDTLLSALLRLSRTIRSELEKKEVDMNILMSDVIKTFDFEAKNAGARIEVSDLPACSCDAVQINQVFSNLIGNAVKFLSPERKGVIKVTGRKEGGQVVYCVEDNGVGIPAREQKNIFEMFHRVNPDEKGGEGIGLTIVRKIVEKHNGKVWVESEAGKGSKFHVQVPS